MRIPTKLLAAIDIIFDQTLSEGQREQQIATLSSDLSLSDCETVKALRETVWRLREKIQHGKPALSRADIEVARHDPVATITLPTPQASS